MKTPRLIAALALLCGFAPGLTLAQGCHHDQRAQISCADGSSWDEKTSSCITVGS